MPFTTKQKVLATGALALVCLAGTAVTGEQIIGQASAGIVDAMTIAATSCLAVATCGLGSFARHTNNAPDGFKPLQFLNNVWQRATQGAQGRTRTTLVPGTEAQVEYANAQQGVAAAYERGALPNVINAAHERLENAVAAQDLEAHPRPVVMPVPMQRGEGLVQQGPLPSPPDNIRVTRNFHDQYALDKKNAQQEQNLKQAAPDTVITILDPQDCKTPSSSVKTAAQYNSKDSIELQNLKRETPSPNTSQPTSSNIANNRGMPRIS